MLKVNNTIGKIHSDMLGKRRGRLSGYKKFIENIKNEIRRVQQKDSQRRL
jgi:hypothetical protein